MPYYKEGKINDFTVSRLQAANGVITSVPLVKSMVELEGYRSRGAKLPYSELIPDHVADPYAHFLNSARDQKMDSALKARGLASWLLPADTGHSFFLRKREFIGEPYNGFLRYSTGQTAGFENCIFGAGGITNFFGNHPTTRPDLKAVGQQLYSSAAPTSEVFDLANFVGELREGFPTMAPFLLKQKADAFRSVGAGYIQTQFGWIPFLRDMQNAGLALKQATEVLQRPSGIMRRSRRRKPTITSTEGTVTSAYISTPNSALPAWSAQQLPIAPVAPEDANGNVYYGLASETSGYRGSHYSGETTKVERWFDGEFVQLPHIGFDPDNFLSRLNELVDPRIDPETLWNLAPWSWLVDWHLRIGDSIAANLLAVDDRVHSVYAYAMQTTTHSVFNSFRVDSVRNATLVGPTEWGAVQRTTMKQRVRANPYGFTAGGADALNESQLAILAALGLTKVGR